MRVGFLTLGRGTPTWYSRLQMGEDFLGNWGDLGSLRLFTSVPVRGCRFSTGKTSFLDSSLI